MVQVRSGLCLAAIVASLGACSGEPEAGREPPGVPSQAAAPAPKPAVPAPRPSATIPREPAALAERLAATHQALAAAIDQWRSDGDLRAHPPPREVTLWALHQQRIHLLLTGRRVLAREVLPLLPGNAAAHARATIRARRGLGEITPPTPGRYRTGPPEPPARLLAHYREAQRRFGVPWPVQ